MRPKRKEQHRGDQSPSGDQSTGIEAAIDAALTFPTERIRASVDGIRRKRPSATPAEVIKILEKRYLLAVSASGGAVGAAAALPVIGTGTALALTAGQVASFLGASSLLALAVADVHGISTDDRARRRALLLTAMLGDEGPELLSQQVGLSAVTWGRTLLTRLPIATVKTVNKALRGRIVKTSAAKAGSLMLGRLLPFGIGAAVGFAGSRVIGNQMIEGVRAAFGPPPPTFIREVNASFVINDPFHDALALGSPDETSAP